MLKEDVRASQQSPTTYTQTHRLSCGSTTLTCHWVAEPRSMCHPPSGEEKPSVESATEWAQLVDEADPKATTFL